MNIIAGVSLSSSIKGNISKLGFFDQEKNIHFISFILHSNNKYIISFTTKEDDTLQEFKNHYVTTIPVSEDVFKQAIGTHQVGSLNYKILAKKIGLIEWII
jgi:hypothetical protein